MIQDYERYHGVALRELIVEAPKPIELSKCDAFGRLNSYLLNRSIAVHIKHSSKRLPPWNFSFTPEQTGEISELEKSCKAVWLIFICGPDGVVSLPLQEFRTLAETTTSGIRSVRIDRAPRRRYRVYGNVKRAELKPRGVARIVEQAFAESAGTSA